MAFRNAVLGDERLRDRFDQAILLREVSEEYLAVLTADNDGGLRALVDAERARRGSLLAKRANVIAGLSFGVSTIALAVAAIALVLGR